MRIFQTSKILPRSGRVRQLHFAGKMQNWADTSAVSAGLLRKERENNETRMRIDG
jgi:hypothetical protein